MRNRSLKVLKEECDFDQETERFFLSLADGGQLSARSVAKTLLLSRTIADIAQCDQVEVGHVAEAFNLRFGGVSQ